MDEKPMATIGVVPIYESELQRMLDEFGIKTTVVYGPQPSNEMLMKRTLEQLALNTRYDYAYWETRYEQAVLSAMLHTYIDTGEVSVGAFVPPPAPTGYVPPIDSHAMMIATLEQHGYLVDTDYIADRIVINLPPSGEMKAPYFHDTFGHVRTYGGSSNETLTASMLVDAIEKPTELRAQPDYLRHDPTKNVSRRRARKAYGRKGDRP